MCLCCSWLNALPFARQTTGPGLALGCLPLPVLTALGGRAPLVASAHPRAQPGGKEGWMGGLGLLLQE